MLCCVFQDEGKLLCYFHIHECPAKNGSGNEETALLYDDAAECRKQQKELLHSMKPADRERFLCFCHGKHLHKRLCGHMECESLVLCAQERDVALYAERYDRSMFLGHRNSGMLLQLIDPRILQQLNERYDRNIALIMTLCQQKPLGETGEKDAMLEKVTGIVQYLVTCKEQLWEWECGSPEPGAPCRRLYQKDHDGSLMAEALDLQDLLLFLKEELSSLSLFDGIRIHSEIMPHKRMDVLVRCGMSAFVCLYVLFTYYVGTISLYNVSDVTVELDTTYAHLHIGSLIDGQVVLLYTQDNFESLRKNISLGQSILRFAEYVLRQQRISYGCQVWKHDAQTQRLELYFSLPILSSEEVVFRHTHHDGALAYTLQVAELALFLLCQEDSAQEKNTTEKRLLPRP